ncbi:MAG: CotH kinase family protein [Bryobacteraceae bacterium]
MFTSKCHLFLAGILFLAVQIPGALAQTDRDFFDDLVLHEIYLTISPTDWQTLRETFLEDTIYRCNLRWRDIEVNNVAIRSRGHGSRSGVKPGLRVDIDRFDSGNRFVGVKSFNLDNVTQDPSLIRERLAMALFTRMGLPAPREAHTRLFINGEYAGLYVIVERIDKAFLRRNFGEDEGYLYDWEPDEGYRFEYKGPDLASYSPVPFKPETNEDNPDPAPLEAMIRAMNCGQEEDFAAAIGQYLDLKQVMTHLALENFISEWDGVLGDFGMNNFYLYRFRGTNLSHFLFWDKDVAFQVPHYPIFQRFDDNVLARRAIAIPEFRQAYLDALSTAAHTAGGAGGWLEQEIERYYTQVREAALADPFKPNSNEEFEAAVEFLREFVRFRFDFVLAAIAADGAVSRAAATPLLPLLRREQPWPPRQLFLPAPGAQSRSGQTPW